MKYGEHTDLVEAFLTHLKSGNVAWDPAWDAARDAAWDAARDAGTEPAALETVGYVAGYVARDAARDTAGYATCAAYEILGHELLAERGNPLIFLPMFGLDIEQLKRKGNQNDTDN